MSDVCRRPAGRRGLCGNGGIGLRRFRELRTGGRSPIDSMLWGYSFLQGAFSLWLTSQKLTPCTGQRRSRTQEQLWPILPQINSCALHGIWSSSFQALPDDPIEFLYVAQMIFNAGKIVWKVGEAGFQILQQRARRSGRCDFLSTGYEDRLALRINLFGRQPATAQH